MALEPFGDRFPRVDPTAFVHPTAVVIGDVEIGAHSSLWPGVVVRGDVGIVRIGERTNIQDNAVIHASEQFGTRIGDDCVVGHLAFVEDATVEDGCLVGIGSRILNGARMRTGSVAAAGAVVLGAMEVPTGCRAQGVPARIESISKPTPQEILDMAATYVSLARRLSESLGTREPGAAQRGGRPARRSL